jgi:flagellin-like hook-associated protein FlgL
LKSYLRFKKVEFGGSEQNKLQFTMSNLSSNIQNIEASRSSIEDADFAAEASAISQNILGLLR